MAIPRFSYAAVPAGIIPSATSRNFEVGISSPFIAASVVKISLRYFLRSGLSD